MVNFQDSRQFGLSPLFRTYETIERSGLDDDILANAKKFSRWSAFKIFGRDESSGRKLWELQIEIAGIIKNIMSLNVVPRDYTFIPRGQCLLY